MARGVNGNTSDFEFEDSRSESWRANQMFLDNIKKVVKDSHSVRETLVKLGFKPNNTTQRNNLCTIIYQLGIDISHFNKTKVVKPSRWTNIEQIQLMASESESVGDLLKRMGLQNKGSNYKTANYHLNRLGIDTSHFVKHGSKTKKRALSGHISLQEILEGKHPQYRTFHLKIRLLNEGIKQNTCEVCSQDGTWNGKNLNMHLDHIDGNSTNHKLENLRILCPNCHSQTETYAGKNR